MPTHTSSISLTNSRRLSPLLSTTTFRLVPLSPLRELPLDFPLTLTRLAKRRKEAVVAPNRKTNSQSINAVNLGPNRKCRPSTSSRTSAPLCGLPPEPSASSRGPTRASVSRSRRVWLPTACLWSPRRGARRGGWQRSRQSGPGSRRRKPEFLSCSWTWPAMPRCPSLRRSCVGSRLREVRLFFFSRYFLPGFSFSLFLSPSLQTIPASLSFSLSLSSLNLLFLSFSL